MPNDVKNYADNLPKLSLFRLSQYFADLYLVSDDSVEWVRQPVVRKIWHLWFFSAVAGLGFSVFLFDLMGKLLENSVWLSMGLRSIYLVFYLWMIALHACLASAHYRYLLSTGVDLRFVNIVYLWCVWILLFAFLYRQLFFLRPSLFFFQNPPFVPAKTVTSIGLTSSLLLAGEFIIYSACVALSYSAAPGLSSGSILVTAVNLIELIGAILCVALLVATFVNKANRPQPPLP